MIKLSGLNSLDYLSDHLKAQQSLQGQRVNGEGVMIKLSGLSPCLLYSEIYFNSVVCRLLSVSY